MSLPFPPTFHEHSPFLLKPARMRKLTTRTKSVHTPTAPAVVCHRWKWPVLASPAHICTRPHGTPRYVTLRETTELANLTDRHIHRRQTSSSRWSSYFRSEGIRQHVKGDLLPREERFDKTSLRKSSTGSARVVHPKQMLIFSKTESLRAVNFSATSGRFQLSRIPHVHHSSHKRPVTDLYLWAT